MTSPMTGSTCNANYSWRPAPTPHVCHLTDITTRVKLGGVWGNPATSPANISRVEHRLRWERLCLWNYLSRRRQKKGFALLCGFTLNHPYGQDQSGTKEGTRENTADRLRSEASYMAQYNVCFQGGWVAALSHMTRADRDAAGAAWGCEV